MILQAKKINQYFKYIRHTISFPLLLAWACTVHQPVKTISESSKQEFRAVFIPAKCWISTSPESLKTHIGEMFHAAKQVHCNVLILDLNTTNDTGSNSESPNQIKESAKLDPVIWSVDNAHSQGMKIFASLDLLGPGKIEKLLVNQMIPQWKDGEIPFPEESWYLHDNSGDFLNPVNPDAKTLLKKMVRNFVMKYDVDGIVLDFSGFQHFPQGYFLSKENPALTGLVEDMVAEATIVKPYLIFGASIQPGVMNELPGINQMMKDGILNFLVPVKRDSQDPDLTGIISDWAEGTVYYPGEGCKGIQEHLSISDDGYTGQGNPTNFIKSIHSGQAFSLDFSNLTGEKKGGVPIGILHDGKTKITDSEGKIGFLLGEKPDTLKIRVEDSTVMIPTAFWKPPFDYVITEKGQAIHKIPWMEFREMPDRITNEPEFHLLCKTSYPATAWINDDTVKVYETGIFFDKIILEEGPNRIRAGVITDDTGPVIYTREIVYEKRDEVREPFPLWIDERSIAPLMNMELNPEDKVRLSFRGSKGQFGLIRIRPDKREIYCSRTDFIDHSVYEAELTMNEWKQLTPHTLTLILRATGENKSVPDLELKTEMTITVMETSGFPWVRVIQDHTRLTYNLGPVRLGGPIRAEYPKGIVMKANGVFGNFYRIHLNNEEEGFVDMENVEVIHGSYSQTPFYITSLSCGPSESGDILSIPYYNPIPYAIYPEPDQKRIRIRLYGAMTSSTWITHLKGRKIIDQVTWSQITPETYEVQVHLATSRIWGYDIRKEGHRLLFLIKYPPEYVLAEEKPLKGLKIAIEAGHGGESYGALGLSGLFEKDINLDLARRFGEICKSHGAEIIQVRAADTTLSLIDKRDKAVNSGADLLISVHANAAGTSRGYLGVGGTSTYYHNPFWADLAERMYEHLLELDLSEFGVVGSFNYTVIRVSEMPSILVEQAFMTHAEDEEKLASPDFRQAMAEKMYNGILDFLTNMKKE
jgi:N-acetylmuramoyl-L-alanine amidase